MPIWRRDQEPLHERLAREGRREFGDIPPHDTRPRWGAAGIHGIHRLREWDAVVRVDELELEADEAHFVTLADGTVIVDGDDDDEELAELAEAVERELPPPYRAHAVRTDDRGWTVAAEAIDVVELPRELEGEELELTVRSGERLLVVDGAPAFGDTSGLEALGEERGNDFVVRATRIDGDLWDVRVLPL